MNEAQAASDTAAPLAPNVPNDPLPSGSALSMGVVVNKRINEAQAAVDAAAPLVPNVPNDTLTTGCALSMGVVINARINEAQSAADAAAPTSAAPKNAHAAAAKADALEAANTSNASASENNLLCCRFLYSKQSLMADKDCFWYQHDNINLNAVGMFTNDIMYGRAVSLPHPSAKTSLTLQLSGTYRACQIDFPLLSILFAPVLLICMH